MARGDSPPEPERRSPLLAPALGPGPRGSPEAPPVRPAPLPRGSGLPSTKAAGGDPGSEIRRSSGSCMHSPGCCVWGKF